MSTLEHRITVTGSVEQIGAPVRRARGVLAAIAANPVLQLFAVLIAVAASVALLTVGIGVAIDWIVPLIFGNELHALSALFPLITA